MGRKALCVGINNFKNYPGAALQGCINDAHNMSGILKDFLGFNPATDITMLTDAQATKANIMQNLKDMIVGAKNGKYSYLVFSLSSHGTQVLDKSSDEPDKADEAFCPYDLAQKGNSWDPNYIINDDELHDLFVQLPKNVLLEVYLDTCHSGTGLKGIDFLLDRRPRYMPPPNAEEFMMLESVTVRNLDKKLLDKGLVHHILWAGCKSNQTSADAFISGSWNGAFTYYWCKEMRNSKNSVSRAEILKRVKKDLVLGHYTQVPQLECQATVRGMKFSEMMSPA